MVQARRVNVGTMVVDHFPKDADKDDIADAGYDFAEWLQMQVAKLYANESSAGGKFDPNSEAYTQWKVDNGYPTEVGQLTGNTLSVLENSELMQVSVRGRKGSYKCIIFINRNTFYDEVGGADEEVNSYIEYFEKTKVPNETITALKPAWAKSANQFFGDL